MSLRGGALVVCVLAAWTAACDRPDARDPPAATALGPAQRIVTLSPDLAELVYTVGAGDRLVGTIEYSDFPPEAKSVPRVGDAFGLDFERLGALRPDLVLAWDGGTPERWIERLRELGYRVETLGVRRLEDVAVELEQIGRFTGREDAAHAAARGYLDRLSALRARYATAERVTVFFQISTQPLYTVGAPHAISAMIELCGGRNIFDDLSSLAADVSAEAVLGRDPQVIIAGDDAGDGALEGWRRWPALTAIVHDNLYSVRAELVTRSSTRLIGGVEEICGALARARERTAEPAPRADTAARKRVNIAAAGRIGGA